MSELYRLSRVRTIVGLILYLAGGWRSYRELGKEFGWASQPDGDCKTARRNVQALEQAGIPIEIDRSDNTLRVHLASDWVARTSWLRRYIIKKEL